ncbi:MAG: Rqc2 family fibronectin-binding protein [Catonella sp.]|uniref:Rqc2 family fibronectin-binding protein n=1 Tax=Catonella sp. TaxID=2382125 RepID=UPI003F9EBB3E
MSFDGSVVAGMTHELKNCLTGGYITKIAQPEKDALVLTVKNNRTQYKLFLSANASLPLAYITSENRKSPMTAPNFCMLLRKHLGNAKILEVYQPEFERIIRLKTEHLDEMGDLSVKYLVIELMGKYSNIILLDDGERVIDSIKHVSMLVSSVREILPGKDYFVPAQEGRINPLEADISYFTNVIAAKPTSIGKAVYTSLTGFSPQLANEICLLSGLDADQSTASLSEADINLLFKSFLIFINYIKNGQFSPIIYYSKNGTPKSFAVFKLHIYDNLENKTFPDISPLLEEFYNSKDKSDRIRQKSTDLKKLITNAISRTANKLDIFAKQLRDTENRDKYRIYGELITTYGYQAKDGDKLLTCTDYYSGKEVNITLDTSIPVMANAKKYFDKYARQKRTYEAVLIQQDEAKLELNHLDSIKMSLDMAENEDDLAEIRKELENAGYAKKTVLSGKKGKAKEAKGTPLHFISSDGFDIFVGKNNIQNDYLTFKLASNSDWWFHAKKCAGSHVLLITNGKEVPDRTFEEAGKLAIHYSSVNTSSLPAGDGTKYEVDYVQKKEVKKPNGAKPGFVVYYTNYSLTADSDISGIRQI